MGKEKIQHAMSNKKFRTKELVCEKVFKKFEITTAIPTDDEFRMFNIEIGRKSSNEVMKKSLFRNSMDQFYFEESKNSQWTSYDYCKKIGNAKILTY